MTDRWIHLDGLVNMRDVGGLPTRDGHSTVARRLIRSDNLQDLTEVDIDRLVTGLGVTDIVDLRAEREVHLEGPGPLHRVESLTHHHHSLFVERPADSPDRAAAQALAADREDADRPRDARFWAEHYLGYLAKRPDSVSAALQVVAGARGAAVVHCAAGKDRTGTVVAMALDAAGVPHDEIVADYVMTAERIEAIMARLAARETYAPALASQTVDDQVPRAESIGAILTAVADGWGGAGGWLREQGWAADDVERLRARLTQP